jgi:hypothetical protein
MGVYKPFHIRGAAEKSCKFIFGRSRLKKKEPQKRLFLNNSRVKLNSTAEPSNSISNWKAISDND